MPRKTCKFQLSRNSTKFDVLARFRETIPMVKSVSSSEIKRINFGFLTEITIFITEITILPFFQKLEFLGSYTFELSHMRLGSQIESGNRSYFSHDLFPCYDSNFIKNCFFIFYNLIHGSMRPNLDAPSCVLSFPFFDLKILF